jgi:glyoxylase-like metal-dependent hydrolase (beta-lactamase superfamily II)
LQEFDMAHVDETERQSLPRLPLGEPWFAITAILPGIFWIREPFVVDFMQANAWLIRGRDCDLLVDAGNGIASLRGALPDIHLDRLVVVATHAHADHVGSLHEFEHIACFSGIADALEAADPDATLADAGYDIDNLGGLRVGPPRLDGPLVTALPADYQSGSFSLRPLRIFRRLREGDVVDLGDRRFEVTHLPGHSPGCIALFDRANGLLVAGDVIYDGPLVDDLHHSDRVLYRASLNRLLDFPISMVIAGHGAPFDGNRLKELVESALLGV